MPVASALRGLSRVMERRGGIGDARLRAAGSALDMKRMEYGLGRQKELDALQRPGLELAASKAAYQNEEMGFNISDLSAQDTMGKIHQWTPDKDGKSLIDEYGVALPGNAWGPEGERLNKDGTPTKIARWKWEQEIMPGITMMNISSIDPVKKLNDVVWEKEAFLKDLPKGSEEYNQALSGLNDAKAVLNDPTQMATAYARQGMLVSEYLAKAYAGNKNPNMIKFLEKKLLRSEKKLSGITGTKKGDAELEKLKQQTATSKALMAKYKAQTAAGGRTPMTAYQESQINAKALEILGKETEMMPQEKIPAYQERRLPEIMETLRPSARTGLGRPEAQLTILTGQDAQIRGKFLYEKVDAGRMDLDETIRSLIGSGQTMVLQAFTELVRANLGKEKAIPEIEDEVAEVEDLKGPREPILKTRLPGETRERFKKIGGVAKKVWEFKGIGR